MPQTEEKKIHISRRIGAVAAAVVGALAFATTGAQAQTSMPQPIYPTPPAQFFPQPPQDYFRANTVNLLPYGTVPSTRRSVPQRTSGQLLPNAPTIPSGYLVPQGYSYLVTPNAIVAYPQYRSYGNFYGNGGFIIVR